MHHYHGLSPDDFDPNTLYEATNTSRSRYKAVPEDLPDEHLFNADPKLLTYDNIIRLATRYSNKDIMTKANEGRPKDVFNSPQAVSSRIRAAMSFMAEEWNKTAEWNGRATVDDVKASLDEERRKHGVPVAHNNSNGKHPF